MTTRFDRTISIIFFIWLSFNSLAVETACLEEPCVYGNLCCEGCACGVLSTDNRYLFINTTINLTCHVEERFRSTINVSDVYFTKDPDYNVILNGDIIIVDNSTIVLQHTVSAEDYRKNFYCETKTKFLGQLELIVEYVPQKTTDFSAIFEDTSILNVKWKHPVQYIFPQDMKVTFEWRADDRNWSRCEPQYMTWTSCRDIRKNIFGDVVDFRINVTNTRHNVTTTTVIPPKTYPKSLRNLYGKPYKMENFREFMKTKSSIQLGWNSKSRAGLFIIKFNTSSELQTIITTNKTQVLIQNLTAYTAYRFEIIGYYTDYKVSSIRVGLPSDPVKLLVRTLQDVAISPPRVTTGGFLIKAVRSTNKRNITVYWQFFKDMENNGPIVKYEVIIKTSDGRNITHLVKDRTQHHYTLTYIPNNISGHVMIKAGTEVGMSAPSPPIYIPSMAEIRPPLLVFVENFNNNEVSVSWELSEEINVTGYTVYWLENRIGSQKDIEWTQVLADANSYTIKNMHMKKDYLFGVSMETVEMSSGITWENCYFEREIEPRKPESVMVHSREHNSVQVTWTKPGCKQKSPVIRYYILYWCPVDKEGKNCTQASESAKISTSDTTAEVMTYKLDNLENGVKYAAWLQSVSSFGKKSLSGIKNYNISTSDVILGNTTDIIPLIASLVSIVLLFTLVVCCTRKWWYKKIKKCYKPDLQIDDVKFKINPMDETFQYINRINDEVPGDLTNSHDSPCHSENVTYTNRIETTEQENNYDVMEDTVDENTWMCSSVDDDPLDGGSENSQTSFKEIKENFDSQSSKRVMNTRHEGYVEYTESKSSRKPVISVNGYVEDTCLNNDCFENEIRAFKRERDKCLRGNTSEITDPKKSTENVADTCLINNDCFENEITAFERERDECFRGNTSEIIDPKTSTENEAVPLIQSVGEEENKLSSDGYMVY